MLRRRSRGSYWSAVTRPRAKRAPENTVVGSSDLAERAGVCNGLGGRSAGSAVSCSGHVESPYARRADVDTAPTNWR